MGTLSWGFWRDWKCVVLGAAQMISRRARYWMLVGVACVGRAAAASVLIECGVLASG